MLNIYQKTVTARSDKSEHIARLSKCPLCLQKPNPVFFFLFPCMEIQQEIMALRGNTDTKDAEHQYLVTNINGTEADK